tara:strand:+ start:268 stop:831 length:564 start_codon:yes stop_codon:yes gene_type:complete
MVALKFKPDWLDGVSGGIVSDDIVKNIAELQADFFSWLHASPVELRSRRLPTTDPVTLFKALMSVDLPDGTGSYVMDYILNLVEKPSREVSVSYLYGMKCDPDQSLEWKFQTENGVTSISMGTCVKHAKSFGVDEEKKAKLLLMTELFLHLRINAKTTDGTSVTAQLFKSQPILAALYAAHVTAYNL